MHPPDVHPPDVLVVGSVNVDQVVEADAFPAPGETVTGRSVRSSIGGKGANQAVAAALAGARVAMIGRVGTDVGGRRARDALAARGVDVASVLAVDTAPTGTAWITVARADNTIVVVPGANADWPHDWPDPAAASLLAAAPVVLAQLEVPMSVVAAAARAARGRFVLNAAPATRLPAELLARCDVLVVNEHELAAAASSTTPAAEVVPAAAATPVAAAHAALRAHGVGAVVTTLGPRGAVLTDVDGTLEIAAPPTDVLDTTGAGDAFTGVLCARLACGASLRDAVRWAVTAGSLAVRRRGTHDAYPDLATLRAATSAP